MMNIELLKKLEDLEQELNKQLEILDKNICDKKEQSIKNVVEDFTTFFENKGFQVTNSSRKYTATYKNLNAVLSFDDPSVDYFGVMFRFDLDLTGLNMPKMIVMLNRNEPSFSISSHTAETDVNAELNRKISDTEESISKVTNRIQNFDNEQWHLYLKPDNQTNIYRKSKEYKNMFSLLSDLLKWNLNLNSI